MSVVVRDSETFGIGSKRHPGLTSAKQSPLAPIHRQQHTSPQTHALSFSQNTAAWYPMFAAAWFYSIHSDFCTRRPMAPSILVESTYAISVRPQKLSCTFIFVLFFKMPLENRPCLLRLGSVQYIQNRNFAHLVAPGVFAQCYIYGILLVFTD